MRRRKDTHIRSEHHPVPHRHQTAVQNRQVEVGIHPVAEGDIAPVVDAEGGLDEDVVADFAEEVAEEGEAFGGEGIEVGGGGGWGEVLGLGEWGGRLGGKGLSVGGKEVMGMRERGVRCCIRGPRLAL